MKFSIIRITAFYIIILSSLAVNSVFAYVSQTRTIHGYVAARGYPTLEVKDKDKDLRYIPKICKYDDNGMASMMSYKSDDVIIMSAEDFQVYLDKYAELLKKWGKDHLIVEDAETETFKNLKSDTLYVVYLNAQNNENPVLLMESPVCLEDSSSLADYKSLLVDKDSGRILQKEKNDNFGYCSAYYLDKDTNEFAEQGGITNLGGFREGDHFLVNPIENAVIKSGLVSSGSNSNGKYTIFYTMPSCFGFEVSFRNFVAAHVVYQVFNPKNAYHPKTY
ncbi:secreted protein, partial [Candidatus Magnetomorum sp. HK-1]